MRTSRPALLMMVATMGAALAFGAQTAGQAAGSAAKVPLVLGAADVVTGFVPANEETNYPYAIAVSDGSGVATAVWVDRGFRAAQRERSGGWTTPVTLGSCPAKYPNCILSTYSLVTDVNGNVTAAWEQWDTKVNRVYVASLPRGGTWTAPHPVAVQAHQGDPVLSTGRNGAVLLTYASWNRATGEAVNAVYKPPGATWSETERHVFPHVQQPVSGISDRGVAVIVARLTGRADNRMRSYRYRPGIGWGQPTRLGIAEHLDLAPYNLSVGPGGRTLLGYTHDPHSTNDIIGRPVLRARIMNPRGRWGRPHRLSAPRAVRSEVPLVTIRGTATVVWTTNRGAVRQARKAPGRRWHVTTAYPRGSGDVLQLDRNPHGDLALLMEQWRGGPRLFAGLRPVASGWSGRVRIPDKTAEISDYGCVAALPGGTALVLTNDVHRGGGVLTYRTLARTITPRG